MPLLCQNCSGSLIYDPDIGKLVCSHCGGNYQISHNDDTGLVDIDSLFQDKSDIRLMEFSIYTCSTCGGNISVNEVEMTSVCPFCGNSGVIFDRISNKRRPDAVIPFMFGKKKAGEKAREHLRHSAFLYEEAREFEFRSIRGIYVPYYIVSADYKSVLTLQREIKNRSGRTIDIDHISRSLNCSFDRLPLEASKTLMDEASLDIEPFDLKGLRVFEEGYLQGFSSDMADEGSVELCKKAEKICRDYVREQSEVKKVIPKGYSIIENDEHLKFGGKAVYALFPIWFVTGTVNGQQVMLLVNGQTGKVLGGPPYSKARYITAQVLLGLLIVPVCMALGAFGVYMTGVAFASNGLAGSVMAMGLSTLVSYFVRLASKRCETIGKLISLSTSRRLIRFAGRRTDND